MRQLLDPLVLPRFSELTPAAIDTALDEALATHAAVIADLTERRPTRFAEVWLPYERAEVVIDALWSAVTHVHLVADTPELREAYDRGLVRIVENSIKVAQNREFYEVLAMLAETEEFRALPQEDQVAVLHAIRGFRLSGVALDPARRERFRKISVELSSLSTAFSNALLDATEAWTEHVTDSALLDGISQTDLAMFGAAARDRGLEGWVITLQQPSASAILSFAKDRNLRARVYEAFGTRASDQGPQAGQFDNSGRIARILELRREAAELLGFPDPVAWSLATKMAASSGDVLAFLRDLAGRAKPAGERELAELQEFAASALGIEQLEPWDIAFASENLRKVRYAIDVQEVRPFFPVERVTSGWMALLNKLFGVELIQRDAVDLYHPDAKFYDVVDADGQIIAGLYVDLHARAAKRGGAWMAPARPRIADGDSVGRPAAYLVCNFAPIDDAAPALLSHADIATLLHETGHALHQLFTRVNRPSIAGTTGFEWDAIELPSQLMEDFAWDREVLTSMSGHYETGLSLPAELFDRLSAARSFQSGLAALRQVEFAMFDIILHLGSLGSDPMEVIEAVRNEVAVVRPPAWHRFPTAFSHVFAGGYASGYYSYLWAEVLAADGFQRFVEAGLVDRATGQLFRDEVLARGASRTAAESFRAFRGRDPDPEAMLRRRGLLESVR